MNTCNSSLRDPFVLHPCANSPMVKHQSDPYHYHHPQHPLQHQLHSDSSRSSSFGSSSLSPSTVASTTMTLTAAAVPRTTSTTALGDIDPHLAQHVECELGLSKRNAATPGSGTRKNAWGNLSYAELISKAITTSAEQRLTLAEIYDWMIKYVPFFRNKIDRVSSAGWKNSIRHNLSLHNRFKRVQSEGTGKSSWWMINPDEKSSTATTATSSSAASSVMGPNTLMSKNGTKQGRRRLGQTSKAVLAASRTAKRTRNPRSSKLSRASVNPPLHQQDTSVTQQISPADLSSLPTYEPSQWTSSQVESENSMNHLYEQDFYSTSINTTLTNGNGNSTGGISSVYSFDDGIANYPANSSSNHHPQSNNGSSDYSYSHFTHHHHPHSLYHQQQQPQPHHSTYPVVSTNSNYYHQPALLNDHLTTDCHLPMESYSTTNVLAYALPTVQPQQQLQQQQLIDPTDDQQLYLRAQSRSSQSSSTSLSPPILTANNPLGSSSSSASSSSSYSYSHKTSSLSGGYHHLNSNGTLTLYGHHHQHHSNIESLLHLNGDDEGNDGDDDDEDDLSNLVHHHHMAMNDDYPSLSSTGFPSNHYPPATSILRTVLKRSAIDLHNQQV